MTTPPIPELSEYRVHVEIPVWWGDQDAFGHVNNTVYLRWFETARIAYADRVGLSNLMAETKIGPILASVRCDFRQQLRYPDVVTSAVRTTRIGRTSLTMEHAIYSRHYARIAALGTSTLVVFDYRENAPIRVPDEIRRAIDGLEGRSLSQDEPRPL